MKQLIILFSVMLFSFSSYSQTGSDAVCMPVEVAKQVAADLIVGDSAKAMLALTEKELDLSKEKLEYKDSLILTAKLKEINLMDQVRNERTQKEAYVSLYNDAKNQYANLSKTYKRYRTKKTFTDVLFITGITALTGLLIFK
jgi:hypothetical protein